MKKDDYKDDIKLITFCRKPIQDGEENISIDAMSTDYFDVIIKQDFIADSEFVDITKSTNNSFENSENIAMHSYPIYCSKEDIMQYEHSEVYSDPFEESLEMPFLSIIQVHITPEVMARVINEHTPDEYMDLFSTDIHKIINGFADNNTVRFRYRLYRSLSVGDFIVIIRSEEEDTSFRISTLFRRRTAINDSQDENAVKLVMYKTYTVLSVYHTAIEVERAASVEGEERNTKNRFVVRCCFSNMYWSDKQNHDKRVKSVKKEIDENILRLNGRYDISVSLAKHGFMQLSPLIAKYKGIRCNADEIESQVNNWDPQNDGFDIVKYLGYMLCKGYLSYVNMRYLISMDEPDCSYLDDIDNDIVVHTMHKDESYLDKKNNSLHGVLRKQFKYIENIIKDIKGYRKNIMYYMSLIGRLIQMCKTINGLSDMRIYSYILMNQLGIVLNGVESYVKILCRDDISNVRSIMDNIEEYLRRSVHALDSYACYVRNNNLQALQTPNYNLEGSFSVEKYLIGYSEFLSEIIEQYNRVANDKNIGGLRQKLVPVFEPDSLHDAISINVLFRERDEMDENDADKRIMLVRCSTFKEIVNIPEIATALFHETAHQFRYESRGDRNDTLVKYGISSCFDIIVSELIKNAKLDLQWLAPDEESIRAIKEELIKAYLCKVYGSDENLNYSYKDKSLYSFKRCFMDTLNIIYDKTTFVNSIRQCLASVIEEAKFELDIMEEQTREYINKLTSLEKELTSLSNVSEDDRDNKFDNIINDAKKAVKYLQLRSDKFKNMGEELDTYHRNKEKIISLFAVGCTMEDIWKEAYDKLTERWAEKKYDNHIGRYLGLDYKHEDSKKEFVKQMNNISFMVRQMIFDQIEENIAQYREITADMFMCKLLNLSAFGYLDYIMRDTPVNRDIPSEYINRFIYVLYSIYNSNSKKDFMNNIQKSINEGVNALDKACQTKLNNNSRKLKIKEIISNNNINLNNLAEMSDECNKAACSLYKDNENSFAEEYSHYDKMYLLLSHLYVSWDSAVKELEKNKELNSDLENGNRVLQAMRADFPDDDTKEYCNKFADYWNYPRMRYGIESKELAELNKTVIQFIQHMYYKNKFKNAEDCYKWEM